MTPWQGQGDPPLRRRYDDEGETAAIVLGSATPFPRHSDATPDRAGFGSAGETGTSFRALRSSVCGRSATPRNRKELFMNWDTIAGNWKQATGKLKEEWGELTDDDLTRIAGKRDQLVGRIQERYGIAKDEAERQVKAWEHRYH
jgi:uncharacterized protein YjbJ (UPF0337 family)